MHCISETICFPVIEDRAKLCMWTLLSVAKEGRRHDSHILIDVLLFWIFLDKICRLSGSEISMIFSC